MKIYPIGMALAFIFMSNSLSYASKTDMDLEKLRVSVRLLRDSSPIRDTRLGNLDQELYFTEEGTDKIRYRPDVLNKENSKVIKKLYTLMFHTEGKEHILEWGERYVLPHYSKLAFNFIKGKKGLPRDSNYGIKLMKTYIHYGHPSAPSS